MVTAHNPTSTTARVNSQGIKQRVFVSRPWQPQKAPLRGPWALTRRATALVGVRIKAASFGQGYGRQATMLVALASWRRMAQSRRDPACRQDTAKQSAQTGPTPAGGRDDGPGRRSHRGRAHPTPVGLLAWHESLSRAGQAAHKEGGGFRHAWRHAGRRDEARAAPNRHIAPYHSDDIRPADGRLAHDPPAILVAP